MNMDRLLESVKKHEGYRNKVYLDTLGKRTVGVGHLCVEDCCHVVVGVRFVGSYASHQAKSLEHMDCLL